MRVDILHYAAPPVVGGVESVISHHARLMKNDGIDVRVLAGRGSQFDNRIPFIAIPRADSRHWEIQATKAKLDKGIIPENFFILVDEIAEDLSNILEVTQILIAHNVCSLNKNLPLTAALKQLCDKNKSLQFILWHHDLAWTTPRYKDELYDGFPWELLRNDWPCAIQVVVSEFRRQELSDLTGIPKEQILVVPNGLDIVRFLKINEQSLEIVMKFNLLNSAPLILLPVRITPRKNIELALHVLDIMRSDYPDATLVVTGPLGPHNPNNLYYFEKLIDIRNILNLTGSVHFLAELSETYLPDTVIADLYRIADVLLLPSLEEGFGIPILEAGLLGIPIFCTNIPTLEELGGSDVNFFSPDEDPVFVANKITQTLIHNPIYNLRVRVRREFSWERIYYRHIRPLLRI